MSLTFLTKRSLLVAALVSLGFIPFLVVEASTVVRSGEVVTLSEDQTVEGDFYGAAGTVNISGVVSEDAVVAGGQITVNGSVNANAFLVGGGVDVHGEIGDDLRIVSGEIKVGDKVNGDLLVIGGMVTVLSTAEIAGDLIVYAGEAIIDAPVGGNILGTVGELRINSEVQGDIDVNVTDLTFGSNANVQGSASYVSYNLAVQAQEANIVGDLVRSDPIIPQQNDYSWSWILPSLMLLFSSLMWYLVSKKTLNVLVARSVEEPAKHLIMGLVFIIVVPIAVVLLFVSMIGVVVGIVLLMVYLLFISLAVVGLIPVVGKYMMIAFSKSTSAVSPLSLFVGGIGFGLLSMIPIVGQIVLIFWLVYTTGLIIDVAVMRSEFK